MRKRDHSPGGEVRVWGRRPIPECPRAGREEMKPPGPEAGPGRPAAKGGPEAGPRERRAGGPSGPGRRRRHKVRAGPEGRAEEAS